MTAETEIKRINTQALPARAQSTARELVMIEFQRSTLEMTKQFLATQEKVMMAYLGARAADKNLAPAPSLPYISTEAVPQTAMRNLLQRNTPVLLEATAEPGQAEYIVETVIPQAVVEAPVPLAPLAREATKDNTSEAAAVKAEAAELNAEELISALIDIVSERTGYPPEMLDPLLDLEADLGIDSIKRVEILNSFRRLLPESKQIALEDGIEKLAGVKTLQGIMDWIKGELCNSDAGALAQASIDASVAARSLAQTQSAGTLK